MRLRRCDDDQPRKQRRELCLGFVFIYDAAGSKDKFHDLLAQVPAAFEDCPNTFPTCPGGRRSRHLRQ